jgi:uncharacterized protein (DUF1778 family)
MPSTSSEARQARAERLEARITRDQKVILKQAAALQGRTLSDFVVHAASEAALRIVEEQRIITLTAREQTVFVEALLNPPKPGPRLRAAARQYRKVMA